MFKVKAAFELLELILLKSAETFTGGINNSFTDDAKMNFGVMIKE